MLQHPHLSGYYADLAHKAYISYEAGRLMWEQIDKLLTEETKMEPDESLHLTIKRPPNPEPTKTLGIFCSLPDDAILPIVEKFLSGITVEKSEEFTGNVKDEALKVLIQSEVLAVMRVNNLLHIVLRENK